MKTEMERILESKETQRRRLRELPWLEKLEILDRLRDRHLLLQRTRPVAAPPSERAPEEG
jgi:hypothetical protein